jgi:hypothetical protein
VIEEHVESGDVAWLTEKGKGYRVHFPGSTLVLGSYAGEPLPVLNLV